MFKDQLFEKWYQLELLVIAGITGVVFGLIITIFIWLLLDVITFDIVQ